MFARLTRILVRTIGFRLAALYATLFALSALVLFGVIYWITGDALRRQLRTTVQTEVAALAADYQNGGAAQVAAMIDRRIVGRRGTAFLLLDPSGRKVAGNLGGLVARAGWQTVPASAVADASEDVLKELLEEPDAHALLALGVDLPDGSFLLVGKDEHPIGEAQEAVIRSFVWTALVIVLLAIAGGLFLSREFLLRIDAINATTRAIIDGRLADRVPTRGTGDELDLLARNLNEMLDRVQMLMDSLRQVSNDIAHDLRTPLGRLRQRLETTRSKARTVDAYKAAIDQAIVDVDGILGTFAALLRIAQIESGTRKQAFADLDLSDLFSKIATAYGAVAEDRGQVLKAAIDRDVHLRGDRELLLQMLANLVENAIRHTEAGTTIQLALCSRPEGPIGVVRDDGPGIPEAEREAVFRRFFRLDRARTTDGSGLGLALVAAIAELHGIGIMLGDGAPGLKVTLAFAGKTGPDHDRSRGGSTAGA